MSFGTRIILLPFFLLLPQFLCDPRTVTHLGWIQDATAPAINFSQNSIPSPFSPPVHFIWGCGSKHPDRIIATHLFYTLCRLSPQRDAFLIGFLNADNQTANNKLPPHPSFLLLLIFFPQGKAAAELWYLTAFYSKKHFIWQTIENTQHSNC